MLNAEEKADIQTRLRKVTGQTQGLAKMVQDNRYCVDVLTQVAAVQSALAQIGKVMLRSHILSCVSHALRHGPVKEQTQKVEELVDMITRFSKTR